MLQLSDPAPAFRAADQDGNTHALSDYAGRWLLLYFYPKDDTPGCTVEACNFRDAFSTLTKKIAILGVSKDTAESHAQFAQKFEIPFPLLVDPDKTIIQAYGADGVVFSKRVTFVIDPRGQIAHIYDNVDPDLHARQILEELDALQLHV